MTIDRDAIWDAIANESARTGLNLSSIGIDRLTDVVLSAVPVEHPDPYIGEEHEPYCHLQHGMGGQCTCRVVPVEGEVEWEYAHEYTDEGGGKHPRKVSASEYAERKPDGHRADGSPYWNYTQKRRRKAGKWEVAPDGE